MQIEVIQQGPGDRAMTREVWGFTVSVDVAGKGQLTIRLNTWRKQQRFSTRHSWKSKEVWSRLDSNHSYYRPGSRPVVPEQVEAQARCILAVRTFIA